jgi:hypothetical protein
MERIKNILKIGDINQVLLSEAAIKFLKHFIWYDDTFIDEDIYSVEDAIQSDHFALIAKVVQKELMDIRDECKQKDCAYVRLVKDNVLAFANQFDHE